MFRKFISGLLAVAMLAALLFSLPGCTPGGRGVLGSIVTRPDGTVNAQAVHYSKDYAPGTWAVYWYLCGTDLETKWGCATADLEEMLEVTLPDNVTVVIETGGTKTWQNNVMNDGKRERFVYTGDKLEKVQSLPPASMGDPNTFAQFLYYCNDNYPAEKQMVLLWDHGGGSLVGMEVDMLHDNDILTLPEFREAIKATPAASGAYEVVGFDACLMATVDMVEILRGSARYLVASEEVEPGIGWDYTGLYSALAKNPTMDGAQLGKAICDSYYAACGKHASAAEVTLSVVDIARADKLLAAYKEVGDEALLLAVKEKQPYFSAFGRAARDAESYGGGDYEMVDLGDLVERAGKLLPQNGKTLLDALKACVVYQVKGPYRAKASGLSCYYNLSGDPRSAANYQALGINKAYAYYHQYAIEGKLSGEAQAYINGIAAGQSVEITPLPPAQNLEARLNNFPVRINNQGVWMMNLGPELASNLAAVFVNLVWVEPESGLNGWYGMSHDLMADFEAGMFTEIFTSTTSSIDDVPVFLEPIAIAPGYVLFASPVMLNGEKYTLHIGYTESTQAYEILGAWKDREEGSKGVHSKILHKLQPGDVIEPIMFLVPVHDDGTTSVEDMPLGEIIVTENTCFKMKTLSGGYYSLTFEMIDYAGKRYTSAPAFFRVRQGKVERLPGGIAPASTQEEQPFDSITGLYVEKHNFYHADRGENITYYTAIVSPQQYEQLANTLGMRQNSDSEYGYTIQIYSDSFSLEPYVDMEKVYLVGDVFEASTAYHQRDIVFRVTKIIEVW